MSSVPQRPAMSEKCCTKCGQTKPLTDFYLKSKQTDRRCAECKACTIARTSAYLGANPERKNAWARDGYHRDVDATRQKRRARHAANPEVACAAAARYRAAHPEKVHQQSIEAGRRRYAADREAICEARRQYRAAHPEKVRESKRRHYHAHRGEYYAANHRRRARIKGNGGMLTVAEWRAIKAAQDHTCLMCGRREPDITLTIDHVIPIAEGGPNIAANVQGLCKPCNSRKGAKTLDLRADRKELAA